MSEAEKPSSPNETDGQNTLPRPTDAATASPLEVATATPPTWKTYVRDSTVQGVLAVVGVVIGVFSLALWWFTRSTIDPVYMVLGSEVVAEKKFPRLMVQWDGQSIGNLCVTRVALWNGGNTPMVMSARQETRRFRFLRVGLCHRADLALGLWWKYMTVEAIKNAISALPREERHSLASWLNELEYDAWDKQMVQDFSPGGRGMALVEKIQREIAVGRTVSVQEGRAAARTRREQSRR